MKVCSQCSQPATHKFYAERQLPNGKLAKNIKGYIGWGKDFLKHNRYRYICINCFPEAKTKLESMNFKVKNLEPL